MARCYSQECWILVVSKLYPAPSCAEQFIDLMIVEMKELPVFSWAGLYVAVYIHTYIFVLCVYIFKYRLYIINTHEISRQVRYNSNMRILLSVWLQSGQTAWHIMTYKMLIEVMLLVSGQINGVMSDQSVNCTSQ